MEEQAYKSGLETFIDMSVGRSLEKRLAPALLSALDPAVDKATEKYTEKYTNGIQRKVQQDIDVVKKDVKTLSDRFEESNKATQEWRERKEQHDEERKELEDSRWNTLLELQKETKPLINLNTNWTGFYKVVRVVGAGLIAFLGFVLTVAAVIKLFF